jgi:hypothetical protein
MDNEVFVRVITASVSPAVMVSGSAMLVMAFLSRQGLLTGRLRELHERALQHAELFKKDGDSYQAERAALSLSQAKAVYLRARNVKWILMFLFAAICLFVLCGAALGFNVLFPHLIFLAGVFFIAGMLSLLVSTLFAMRGSLQMLTPLKNEQEETEKLLKELIKTENAAK